MNTTKQGVNKKTKHKWTSTWRNLKQHKINSTHKPEHYCEVNNKISNMPRERTWDRASTGIIHTSRVLLFYWVRHRPVLTYPLGLLHWYWEDWITESRMHAKLPWRIYVNRTTCNVSWQKDQHETNPGKKVYIFHCIQFVSMVLRFSDSSPELMKKSTI